jgi:hypothetical protein
MANAHSYNVFSEHYFRALCAVTEGSERYSHDFFRMCAGWKWAGKTHP